MCSIICSWGSASSLLVGLSRGGEVTTYGVLPALFIGEEEQDGMKMGKEEQDIVGQSCGMYRAKGVVKWWTQRGQ